MLDWKAKKRFSNGNEDISIYGKEMQAIVLAFQNFPFRNHNLKEKNVNSGSFELCIKDSVPRIYTF